MEQMQTPAFGEQEKMTDLLSSEKLLTGIYNTFCCEAATASVQSCLLSAHNKTRKAFQAERYQNISAIPVFSFFLQSHRSLLSSI